MNFSTGQTSLVKVQEENDDKGFKTVIKIDPDEFVAGSVVLYRTFLRGADVEEDEPEVRTCTPDFVQVNRTKVEQARRVPGVPDTPVSRVWASLGMDRDPYGATEWMLRMGQHVSEASTVWFPIDDPDLWPPGLYDAVKNLNNEELNAALYRVGDEEMDLTDSVFNHYNVPGFGPLSYCGLQGFVSPLLYLARRNDLGHPVCGKLQLNNHF
jgi:glycogen debranching enzyme